MVTLEQLVEDIHRAHLAFGKTEVSREDVADIVRATIKGVGFHINEKTGEVVDPRPPPNPLPPPRDTGMYYSDQRRRRRAGRR